METTLAQPNPDVLSQLRGISGAGEFLQFVGNLCSTGQIENPTVKKEVHKMGNNNPLVWGLHLLNITHTVDDETLEESEKRDRLQNLLDVALVLGMRKRKSVSAALTALVDRYSLESSELQKADIERRNFLRNALLVTAAATVANPILWAGTRAVNSSKSTESPHREQLTVFDEFIGPLKEETRRRRQAWARSDPYYYHKVDRELNEDENGDSRLINILLFSTGPILRPGHLAVITGANQIISINTKSRTVSLVAITSDTRAPNIERYLQQKRGETGKLRSINGAFDTGQEIGGDFEGFNLMRETFEQATGLSMDFQVVFSDGIVKDFIDQVLGGLEVDLPYDLATYKIQVDGQEFPDKEFRRGKQHLDGTRVLQFMKGETINKWEEGRLPHHRKNIVMDAVTQMLKKNVSKLGLALDFMDRQIRDGRIKLDFDLNRIINLDFLKTIGSKPLGFDELKVDQTITMMDAEMGGEGVRFVSADRDNPITRKDIDEGVYPNDYEGIPGIGWWSGVEIPYNGNPHADDLVSDYWGETRRVVKRKLLPETHTT